MEKKIKKPYVRPISTVTRVELESPICNDSGQHTPDTPQPGNSVEAHEINKNFTDKNNFSETPGWN